MLWLPCYLINHFSINDCLILVNAFTQTSHGFSSQFSCKAQIHMLTNYLNCSRKEQIATYTDLSAPIFNLWRGKYIFWSIHVMEKWAVSPLNTIRGKWDTVDQIFSGRKYIPLMNFDNPNSIWVRCVLAQSAIKHSSMYKVFLFFK